MIRTTIAALRFPRATGPGRACALGLSLLAWACGPSGSSTIGLPIGAGVADDASPMPDELTQPAPNAAPDGNGTGTLGTAQQLPDSDVSEVPEPEPAQDEEGEEDEPSNVNGAGLGLTPVEEPPEPPTIAEMAPAGGTEPEPDTVNDGAEPAQEPDPEAPGGDGFDFGGGFGGGGFGETPEDPAEPLPAPSPVSPDGFPESPSPSGPSAPEPEAPEPAAPEPGPIPPEEPGAELPAAPEPVPTTDGECVELAVAESFGEIGTEAICFVVTGELQGWQVSNLEQRGLTINGQVVEPPTVPEAVDGTYVFAFSAGEPSYTSFGTW